MDGCKRCGSVKLTAVRAKTSDMCSTTDLDTGQDINGYANENIRLAEISDGCDYISFTFCAVCGQIQGNAWE